VVGGQLGVELAFQPRDVGVSDIDVGGDVDRAGVFRQVGVDLFAQAGGVGVYLDGAPLVGERGFDVLPQALNVPGDLDEGASEALIGSHQASGHHLPAPARAGAPVVL
jgi:hypothetical protein